MRKMAGVYRYCIAISALHDERGALNLGLIRVSDTNLRMSAPFNFYLYLDAGELLKF